MLNPTVLSLFQQKRSVKMLVYSYRKLHTATTPVSVLPRANQFLFNPRTAERFHDQQICLDFNNKAIKQ